jgi:hypothetical protein
MLLRTGKLPILLAVIAVSCFGQQLDKAAYGRWNLDITKSKLSNPPKVGTIAVEPDGWVAASYFETGRLVAFAVKTDGTSCTVIGLGPGLSCSMTISDPRHVSVIMTQGENVVRRIDVVLEGSNVFTAKDVITTANGQRTAELVYERMTDSSPANKR